MFSIPRFDSGVQIVQKSKYNVQMLILAATEHFDDLSRVAKNAPMYVPTTGKADCQCDMKQEYERMTSNLRLPQINWTSVEEVIKPLIMKVHGRESLARAVLCQGNHSDASTRMLQMAQLNFSQKMHTYHLDTVDLAETIDELPNGRLKRAAINMNQKWRQPSALTDSERCAIIGEFVNASKSDLLEMLNIINSVIEQNQI